MSDLYREYINANFGPEDDDHAMRYCRNEDCETSDPRSDKYAPLPEKPAGTHKVRDRILSWETIYDTGGMPVNQCPAEWSWVDEPFWKCEECGEVYTLDEVNQ
jgi:hypothetical protein